VNICIDFRVFGISSLFYEYNSTKDKKYKQQTYFDLFLVLNMFPHFGRMASIWINCQNKSENKTSSQNVAVVEYAVLRSMWNSLPI